MEVEKNVLVKARIMAGWPSRWGTETPWVNNDEPWSMVQQERQENVFESDVETTSLKAVLQAATWVCWPSVGPHSLYTSPCLSLRRTVWGQYHGSHHTGDNTEHRGLSDQPRWDSSSILTVSQTWLLSLQHSAYDQDGITSTKFISLIIIRQQEPHFVSTPFFVISWGIRHSLDCPAIC